MTDKQKLEQKLWDIANTLRGKMGADDFRDYILGFIFYKYLSEKMHTFADKILKPDGMFCVGEVVSLSEKLPQFVLDIYDATELEPLQLTEIEDYYLERNFEIIEKKDLSFTLKDYYSKNLYELKKSVNEMEENEKSYYKKLIKMISHEAKAFLNEGTDEHIGFYSLILKKK